MTFAETVESQWSDYADRQRNRANLLIHAVAVPIVWWATIQALGGLFLLLLGVPGAFGMILWAAILVGASLFLQHRGSLMEKVPPPPIGAPKDFALRAAAEQFVNFPRFLFGGGWLRNLRQAG